MKKFSKALFPIYLVMFLNFDTLTFMEPMQEQKISIEEIKNSYEPDQIVKSIIEFKKNYVLVEWHRQRDASRFDLFNLETGIKDKVYGDFYYVSLLEIINENGFVFLTNGHNHINAHVGFPFILEYRREDSAQDFTEFMKCTYLPLDKGVKLGFGKNMSVSDVVASENGIKVLFDPLPEHYAGAGPDIPPITTAFIGGKKQFIITIEDASSKFDLDGRRFAYPGYGYIEDVVFEREPNKITIVTTLTSGQDMFDAPLRFYTGYIGKELSLEKNERTYVQFIFSKREGPENWRIGMLRPRSPLGE